MCRGLLLVACLGRVVMAAAGLGADGNIISTASSINFDKASKTSVGVSTEDVSWISFPSQGQSDATAAHASDDSVQGSDVVGLLTAEERDYAIIVLQKITYVILPFALLVTVCNVVVFVQRSLRNSTSKYIIALSLAQIIYICIDIGARIMVASFERGIPYESAYFAYNIYGFTWVVIIRRASYLVICFVSIERIYAIVRPLHVKSFVLVRYPVTFILASYAVTTVYHFYIFAKLRIEEIHLPNGDTMYNFAYTDFYNQNAVAMENIGISAKALFSYLPLLVLLTLNIMTLVFLQRHSAARMKMNTSASTNEELKKQRQMTVTILGATIGYVVLSLPLAFHSLFGNFHPRYNYFGPERNVFLVFQEFAYVCHMFSCFTDFFSFLLLSTAYRRTFIRVFGLRRCFDKKQYAESDTVAISVDSSVTTKS